jgi:guanylate kinase
MLNEAVWEIKNNLFSEFPDQLWFFMQGNLIIVSSPSGGGKGTLIKEILRTVPHIGYSVSFTTRQIRDGEQHGRDYFFISRSEFESLINENLLLEFAEVHGNFYGTSLKQVKTEIEAGHDIILEIDVQGAARENS